MGGGRFDPDVHHRRSIRLPGYDYGLAGAYFVTVCVEGRACLFGEVVDGEMRMNDAGIMIERWLRELPTKFGTVQIDAMVVMPNHIHGVVLIQDDAIVVPGVAAAGQGGHAGPPLRDHPVGADLRVRPGSIAGRPTLGQVIQWFKTMSTNEYIRGVKDQGRPEFWGRLWQRNYYEHVVRNDNDLNRIWQYISDNPANWHHDEENPERA